MKPCAFEMHRPRDLADALELLERHGDEARLIAGGQSLVSMMNLLDSHSGDSLRSAYGQGLTTALPHHSRT